MEMSPNTASSTLLPWLLCLMFLLTSDSQAMTSAPTYGTPSAADTTLLFDGGASGSNLRNCSCSAPVQDCDEALANSLCRCHTVLRSSLRRLRQPGHLTVWVKELWVLEELLNSSTVVHLKLSFCGIKRVQSQQLVLLGLRTLRIHSAAPGAPYPNQELGLWASAGSEAELESQSLDVSSSFHVTFIDTGTLNGVSALKAYSVLSSPPPTFSQFFPHLVFPITQPSSAAPDDPVDSREKPAEPPQTTLLTFVY